MYAKEHGCGLDLVSLMSSVFPPVVTAISGLVAEVNRDILSKQENAGPVQVQTEVLVRMAEQF